MEYEKFKELVDLMKSHNEKVSKMYKDFGIDLVELFNDHSVLVDRFWDLLIEEKGLDWIGWFFYEKGAIYGKPNKEIKAWDGDVEICRDLKGLYKYLVENKYFKNQK